MNLRADPVDGERHQPHADVRIETLDGLHEAHIAFLHQIAHGQPIAQVPAGDVHDEPQVRQHQLTCGVQVGRAAKPGCESDLIVLRQNRDLRYAIDIGIQAPDGACKDQSSLFGNQGSH